VAPAPQNATTKALTNGKTPKETDPAIELVPFWEPPDDEAQNCGITYDLCPSAIAAAHICNSHSMTNG
jgi:hypothetical protein